MTLEENIDKVRRRIGDSKKSSSAKFKGDGSETVFSLGYNNVFDVKVYINSNLIAEAAYTVSHDVGNILTQEAPPAESDIYVTFSYAAYNDAQIQKMVETYGVEGAVIESLNELLADSARFYDYSQGQTTDKRSQIFEHLKDLLAMAKDDLAKSTQSDFAVGSRHHTHSSGCNHAEDLTRIDKFVLSNSDRLSSNNV